MFEELLGNDPIKAYLSKATSHSRLPHALLFSGIDGIGKRLFAYELAAHLLHSPLRRVNEETHPDFRIVRPEGKSGLHSIETLRAMIDEVHSAPFEAPGKVFLITDAERMQPAAANALLKTLEEPSPGTTLILLTQAPREMLPTILSRCAHLQFQPLSQEQIKALLEKLGHPLHFAKQGLGSIGRAVDRATRASLEEPLFRLLSRQTSWSERAAALESFDELIEDEDPVRKSRNAERLFDALLMWHRDQHARKLGLGSDALFFPDEPAAPFSVPSLESLSKKMETALLAFQRNMKFSVCLERVLS